MKLFLCSSGNSLLDLIRPTSLFDMVGHRAVIGPSSPLRQCFETSTLHHMIIVGPSGSGKVRKESSHFLLRVSIAADNRKVFRPTVIQYIRHFCPMVEIWAETRKS